MAASLNGDDEREHLYHYFIDPYGNWYCEGNPVTDPHVFRLLSRSLHRRAEDGRYAIRCEGETHPVEVADAPLHVHCVYVDLSSDGELTGVEIELVDGRREPLATETLTVVHNDSLYCLATPRRLRAKFGKTAYYELTQYLQEGEGGEDFYFVIDGRKFPIVQE